ncbi:MAG: polymerase III subunit delta protein [Candidatus Saccharibacteria bacterium GW2011_GWC2_48_9]|nr:MAG: polymerase III subunit delta protein [Candidatus Saccharibacteria bacterium GW2011_GWC2_48_9]
MIILLTGDNFYEIDQELDRIIAGFGAEPERIDADTLEVRNLTDIFGGLSLFNEARLVVLRRVSENANVWEEIAKWAQRDSDTTVVLVAPKVDKRTKTYKLLAAHADVRVFTAWGDRDTGRAEQWLGVCAKQRGISLDSAAAREIVRRRGTEQYQLINTLEQLAVFGDITKKTVEVHIEAAPHENIFELLEASLGGDPSAIRTKIALLRPENDPYMTMGLLASQAFSLAGLVLSNKSPSEVAQDIGVSPYALRNLAKVSGNVDRARLASLVVALADTDIGMKSSPVDPWTQIEIALMRP